MSELTSLEGKRGLVVGIANDQSIAYGCARAFREAGADLAVTFLNAKAEPHVRPLAESLGASLILPCDVSVAGALEQVFAAIESRWGQLDFVLHSIAFAPREDLQSNLIETTAEGFSLAMDVSCHSFIRMARLARPLMRQGGSLMTVSFLGSDRVVDHYNLMGPVKAALESSVRTLAVDLAGQNIHVHALSTGAITTRAASGIAGFPDLLEHVRAQTPAHRSITIREIGSVAAFLASAAAAPLTGSLTYIDHGFHITA